MEKMSVYECPLYGLMFGGNNLNYKVIKTVPHVECPVCQRMHALDGNNLIKEEKQHGKRKISEVRNVSKRNAHEQIGISTA